MRPGNLQKWAWCLAVTSLVTLSGCGGRNAEAPSTDEGTTTATLEAGVTPSAQDAAATAAPVASPTPEELVLVPGQTQTTEPVVQATPEQTAAPVATAQPLPPGANRLGDAQSPYLRRAAENGVHWMEWNNETLERAKAGNRPLLIFVGSNWCEYCHLMDATTFADPEVVRMLNEDFVAVKVDRDERPDLDERLQAAHYHINTKPGGWPLTVFALPDGRPFDALTYVPPQTEGERVGMRDLLRQAADVMRNRRADAERLAAEVQAKMGSGLPAAAPADAGVDAATLTQFSKGIRDRFDTTNGGFGGANDPRFPNGTALLFLLQQHSDTGNSDMLSHVTRSLMAYFKGGLRDNVHGGYFRYSADAEFRQPRFEKMLYTQAELLSAFTQAYAATGRPIFKEAAQDIIRFTRDTFENPEGGFYASMDADVDATPGNDFHTWTAEEVRGIVPGRPADVFIRYFNIGAADNSDSEGRSVTRSSGTLKETADAVGATPAEAQTALDTARAKLREARTSADAFPYVDKTIIAPWNGPMISAYIDAYRFTGDKQARDFALKSADYILTNMASETDGIAHSFVKGKATVHGLLDPQVQMAAALLDCFEASGSKDYLETAQSIMEFVEARFLDEKLGLYRDRASDPSAGAVLETPRFHLHDTMAPSPNGMAAITWYRLYQATGKEDCLARARRIVAAAAAQPGMSGPAAGTMARAAALIVNAPPKALIIGDPDDATVTAMREAALPVYRLGKLVETLTPEEAKNTDYPPAADGKPIAYVCTAKTCAPPVRKAEEIPDLLRSFGKGGTGQAAQGESGDRRAF